jgi:hypothetical protein
MILHEDLGLVKEPGRWVLKLLNKYQKKDWVGKDNDLLNLIWSKRLGV